MGLRIRSGDLLSGPESTVLESGSEFGSAFEGYLFCVGKQRETKLMPFHGGPNTHSHASISRWPWNTEAFVSEPVHGVFLDESLWRTEGAFKWVFGVGGRWMTVNLDKCQYDG